MRVSNLKTSTKSALLKPAYFFNSEFDYVGRMEFACARGALGAATRTVDPLRPATWEFSAFSQNGEDGIIDHLVGLIEDPERNFLEIGSSDGLENNTAYLAFVKGFAGIGIEGNPYLSGKASRFLQRFNWAVRHKNMLVEPRHADAIVTEMGTRTPDFFSLDIDSNDYHVTKALLERSFRPSVVCVEYNSAFGPDQAVTIPYTQRFEVSTAHPSRLYYGASIAAYRALFKGHGYRFVSVDQRGVNAFFVAENVDLPSNLSSSFFGENVVQRAMTDQGWEAQFAQISEMPLLEV